jgi:hypothetical protein
MRPPPHLALCALAAAWVASGCSPFLYKPIDLRREVSNGTAITLEGLGTPAGLSMIFKVQGEPGAKLRAIRMTWPDDPRCQGGLPPRVLFDDGLVVKQPPLAIGGAHELEVRFYESDVLVTPHSIDFDIASPSGDTCIREPLNGNAPGLDWELRSPPGFWGYGVQERWGAPPEGNVGVVGTSFFARAGVRWNALQVGAELGVVPQLACHGSPCAEWRLPMALLVQGPLFQRHRFLVAGQLGYEWTPSIGSDSVWRQGPRAALQVGLSRLNWLGFPPGGQNGWWGLELPFTVWLPHQGAPPIYQFGVGLSVQGTFLPPSYPF